MRSLRKFFMIMLVNSLILGCFTAEKARASLVEVMQRDPTSPSGWISITADLVSLDSWKPESTRLAGISGSVPSSLGSRISADAWDWEYREIGPIAADIRLFRNDMMNPYEGQVSDRNVSGGRVSGMDNGTAAGEFPGFGESTIAGLTGPTFSGEIHGTIHPAVTVEFNGFVQPVSAVPLPGTAGLIGSGLMGLSGLSWLMWKRKIVQAPPSCSNRAGDRSLP
jgi:hypothetical protein